MSLETAKNEKQYVAGEHISRRNSLAASKPTPSTRMCPVEPARFQAENHGKKHVEEWNLSREKKDKRLFPRSRTKTH